MCRHRRPRGVTRRAQPAGPAPGRREGPGRRQRRRARRHRAARSPSATSSRARTPPSARRSRPPCGCAWSCCPARTRGSASAAGRCTMLDAERGIEDGAGLVGGPRGDRGGRAGRRPRRDPPPAHRLPPGAAGGRDAGGRSTGADAAVRSTRDAVNAALLCRDHLVGSLSDRSVRLLRGLMDPHTTQSELAHARRASAPRPCPSACAPTASAPSSPPRTCCGVSP